MMVLLGWCAVGLAVYLLGDLVALVGKHKKKWRIAWVKKYSDKVWDLRWWIAGLAVGFGVMQVIYILGSFLYIFIVFWWVPVGITVGLTILISIWAYIISPLLKR